MSNKHDQFDYLYKIVMIGDSGVGKTNLLSRFIDDSFTMDSKPTIGVQFATKTIHQQGITIKNQIWDTAGQQRFRAITNAYYRGAVGAIIAFDLTKSKTFENVQKWLNELKENAQSNITIMLLGNKSDLVEGREVKEETAQDFAENNKLIYLETSAASGENVDQAFSSLIKEIYIKMKETPKDVKLNPIGGTGGAKSDTNNKDGVSLSEKKEHQNTTSTATNSKEDKKNIKLKGEKQKKEKKKGCC